MTTNTTPQRTLVITIRREGLTDREAAGLTDRVRQILGADRYKLTSQQVIGSARLSVGPYSQKAERIKAIEKCPPSMTAGEVAQSLGLSERQVKRYRALLKCLSEERAA